MIRKYEKYLTIQCVHLDFPKMSTTLIKLCHISFKTRCCSELPSSQPSSSSSTAFPSSWQFSCLFPSSSCSCRYAYKRNMFPFTLNTITSVLSYSPHIAAPVRALRATAEASGLDLSLAHLQLLQRESCWSHLHPSVQLPRPVHVARRPPARPEPERVVHRLHVQQVLLLHCRLLQGCDSFLVCL